MGDHATHPIARFLSRPRRCSRIEYAAVDSMRQLKNHISDASTEDSAR